MYRKFHIDALLQWYVDEDPAIRNKALCEALRYTFC